MSNLYTVLIFTKLIYSVDLWSLVASPTKSNLNRNNRYHEILKLFRKKIYTVLGRKEYIKIENL